MLTALIAVNVILAVVITVQTVALLKAGEAVRQLQNRINRAITAFSG